MKINLRKVVVVVIAVVGMLLTTACSSNISPEGYTFKETKSGITFHIERKDRNTAVLFVPFDEAPKTPLPLDEEVLDPKWRKALERAANIFNYANVEHNIKYDTTLEFELIEEETAEVDSIMYTFEDNPLVVLWTEDESYVMLSIFCPKTEFQSEDQEWQQFLHVCYDIAKYAKNYIPEDVA